jgi:hypothetical protein
VIINFPNVGGKCWEPTQMKFCALIVKDVVVVFHEAFHPSIHPVIHPWMASYREENPGRNK